MPGRSSLFPARQKIAQARADGGALLEAIIRGHGCCMVNDPEFDQSLWDEARKQALDRDRMRQGLEECLLYARGNPIVLSKIHYALGVTDDDGARP